MNETELQKVRNKLPLSQSCLKRNPPEKSTERPALPSGSPKRIRQDHKPLLNKLESEFKDYLSPLGIPVIAQSLRFKLANGLWYKPDFVYISMGKVVCYEVKGPHAFRGGFENLKMAAHQYPQIDWMLAWKRGGQWQLQPVLP